MSYLGLLVSTIVVALVGSVFIAIAALMARAFGANAIWRTWAIFVAVASCVYTLARMHTGISSGLVVPVGDFVGFIAGLGVPLACGAYVLHRLTRQDTGDIRLRHLAASWCACLAAMPMALLFSELIGWTALLRGVIV